MPAPHFNLSSAAGLASAKNTILALADKHGISHTDPKLVALLRRIEMTAIAINPIGYLARKAIDSIAGLASHAPTIEAQKDAALEIIEASRNAGVASIKFTLDQEAGLEVASHLPGFPVRTKLEKTGKMTIEVIYENKNGS